MEQQQKKRDGPVRCVCEERRATEHPKSAEPEVVHGSTTTTTTNVMDQSAVQKSRFKTVAQLNADVC